MRTLAFVALAVACSAWMGPGARVHAQDAPADVSLEAFGRSDLPAAPEGFESRSIGTVRWDYPVAVNGMIDELEAARAQSWPRIARELGDPRLDASVLIRVARSPDEMAALAPPTAPPPPYAIGVAYPASGLVLLTLAAPVTWERPDVARTLVHELSHIAVHRASGGASIPRWLSEGLAIHQARERSIERVQTLWNAVVAGQIIPLDQLSGGFPERSHGVSVAYAQSADFVAFLHRRRGEPPFGELLGRMSRGASLPSAVSQTFSASLGELEYEWHQELTQRYGMWPLLFGSGAIWAFAALLMVLAYVRLKQRARLIMKRWELEEQQAELAREQVAPEIALISVSASRAHPSEVPSRAQLSARKSAEGETERRMPEEIPPERHSDPAIPKVTHEGRSHTLH